MHRLATQIALGMVALCVLAARRADAQDPSAGFTLQVSSKLTLVDVIASRKMPHQQTLVPVAGLTREDFRVFDDGHEMPIGSFDIGAEHKTRPIALWLIVQCNDGQPIGHHSMWLQSKTRYLRPALQHLDPDDRIGVAHWCDNGDAVVDLAAGRDSDKALGTVESVLNRDPLTGTQSRNGELSMQRMIRLVLQNTDERTTHRQPILLFLYGDRCGTRVEEADSILMDLLESSAMVYGLNDGTWYDIPEVYGAAPPIGAPHPQMTYHLVHYYSHETGGELDSTSDPARFSDTLNDLLDQLHNRYTIGFRPLDVDGKRHRLEVKLTPEAHKRFKSVELRYRLEYVPVPEP